MKYGSQSGVYDKSVSAKDLKTSHTLSLTGLYAGHVYVFIASSRDAVGNSVQSKPIAFTTPALGDGTRPTLAVNIPEVASGRIKVPVDAQDNTGVERVLFFLDGKGMFTDYSAPFEWFVDTTTLFDGPHRLVAIAIDAAGNRTEAARDFTASNRFPITESPIDITINRPAQGSTVVGVVEIDASITHSKKARITDAEIHVDGVVVHRVTYPAPILFESERTLRDFERPVRISWNWDTARIAAGAAAVIEVIAHDSAGNAGHASARVTKGTESPAFELSRTVTRLGNYFHVSLTVRNSGSGSTAQATDLLVKDISRGFAAVADRLPSYDWNRAEITAEKTVSTLAPGASVTYEYDAVPVLMDPAIDDYRIGSRTVIQYRNWRGISGTAELSSPYIPGDATSPPYPLIQSQVADAISACDYMIVTDPERLFASYPAEDVNALLQTMARLAIAKSGVLGFRRPGASWVSANNLRANVGPAGIWGSRLRLESALNGYLLIVGEASIVPSFDVAGFNAPFNGGPVDVVHYTDYPYADTTGDERVELRVGRAIGLNARELMRPLEVSLGVHLGRFTFDRSNALLVSGPEGTWENFIAEANELGDVLTGQGMTVEKVHAEYDHEEAAFLREALVMRGDYRCLDLPGHLVGTTPCPKTHPPTSVATLRTLITKAQAEEVQANRRGIAGTYTTYATLCPAGNEHGLDTKRGARDKDVIFWGGHGGPGGWGWVLDDFAGACGAASNMVVEHATNPLRFGSGTPVVFAASCLTGNYMAEPGRSGARAFTRNGAAVYLGATEVTPCGPQQGFTLAFFRTHWTSSTTTTGDGLARLRNATILLGDIWWRYMGYEFNHYGDPKFVGR
ncbi:MAG: C25 family cysteine peptidase [Bacillota bacterium]|nr:C25 family cysteine peptidase [Bacillota bacterium]